MTSAINAHEHIPAQATIADAGRPQPQGPNELVFGDPALEEFSIAARLPTPALIGWMASAAWNAFCAYLACKFDID